MGRASAIGIPGPAFLLRGHPLQPREPAVGYASRLAALPGVPMAQLLKDMRINPRELGRGGATAVGQLAALRDLGPGDRNALSKYTPWRALGDQIPTVAGERLMPGSVLATSVRVCPQCIAEDIAAFAGPVAARPWLRLEWIVNHVRVCRRHGNMLFEVVSSHPTHRTFDFCRTVADQVIPELDRLALECAPGPGTGFCDWLVARLDGIHETTNSLDDVPLHAAVAFCEALGLSALHPSDTTPSRLTLSEWARAAEEGYRAASQGPAAVTLLLDSVLERFRPPPRGSIGQEKVYGFLYIFLRRTMDDPAFEKFRQMVRDHAFATLPFKEGHSVLGVELGRRRVHTLRSASRDFARTDAGTLELLAGIDLAGQKPDKRSGRTLRIPVANFELAARASGARLNTKQVAERTGFDTRLVDALADRHLLPVVPEEGRLGRARARFEEAEVEAFMTRLFRDAVPTESPSGRRMPVAKARNTARGHAVDILGLILDGSLSWVGRLGEGDRSEHLLVDVDEVVAVTRARRMRIGLHAQEAVALIPGVSRQGIGHLAKAGLIATMIEFSPESMGTVGVLMRESVDAFVANYVSVTEISDATAIDHRVVARRLMEAGVAVAIDQGIALTRIYRRDEVVASRIFNGWPTLAS